MKKVFSILLAIYMLASHVGIAANTHYCGGVVAEQSFSLGIEQLDCGMGSIPKVCEPTKPEGLNATPCCENVHEILQMQHEANVKKASVEVSPTFFVAFVFATATTLFSIEGTSTVFREYVPPIVRQNVQVLFQTFLI